MPVTLAQAALNARSALDLNVIDEFRKNSYLLDRIPFDQSVNPAGGGSTLTYGYTRLITQPTAAFRAINAEYTPQEVTKAQYSTDLKPLGGTFQVDRILAGIGAVSEVTLQLAQKIKATKALFNDTVINGDTAVDANSFDGLSKALAGSSTELATGPVLDFTAVSTQALALTAMQRINAWLGLMDGRPDALLMNSTAASWFTLIAAFAGQIDKTTDSFGLPITSYQGIPIVDLGFRSGSALSVIPTYVGTNEVQRITIGGTPTGGTFTLTFRGQTTAPIAYNASAANVVTALTALSSIGAAGVSATGGALPGATVDVTFLLGNAGINVPVMTIDITLLTGGTPTGAITTVTGGGGAAGTGQTGLTDIYAVRFGIDGFHAVAVPGKLINTWLPDFDHAGAVKTGEVEMGPVAVVLKATKAAAVLRNVKVA